MEKSRKGGTYTLGREDFRENEKFRVNPFRQADMRDHNHNFFELVYVTGGSAVHTLNGVSKVVQTGDYFILDYESTHSYTDCQDLELINCLFLPEVIDETMADCRTFEEIFRGCLIRYYRQYFGLTPANRIFFDDTKEILSLIQGMQREYEEKKVGFAEIFRSRLLEILIRIMRNIMEEENDFAQEKSQQSSSVLLAIQYLKSNYGEKAVLKEFCREQHYSLPYISRRFKQETGLTVSDYLQRIRVEKSCELLAGSDLRISEVAHLVGYEDVKFFDQLFRRHLHMSPRDYLKMSCSG